MGHKSASPALLATTGARQVNHSWRNEPAENTHTAAQIKLFAIRCSDMRDRIAAGEVPFIDGIDMLYSAAVWSGLVDGVGDDAVQRVMAAAFTSGTATL
jgi:hypothetical protein